MKASLLKAMGVAMLMSVPGALHAQFTFEEDANGDVTLTAYAGTGGDVVIPSVGGPHLRPVTRIGINTFTNCTTLTAIIIPNSVRVIDGWCFMGCTNLPTAEIPDSVQHIGSFAFSFCTGLTNVSIGAAVTNIGACAFYGCSSLSDVYFTGPKPQISIGCFCGGKSQQWHLTENTWVRDLNLDEDGQAVFSKLSINDPAASPQAEAMLAAICRDTRREALELAQEKRDAQLDALREAEKKAKDSACNTAVIRAIVFTLMVMAYLWFESQDVVVPDTVTFQEAIPGTLVSKGASWPITSIGDSAFASLPNLKTVRLGRYVDTLGDKAFADCVGLSAVFFPSNCPTLGSDTFSNSPNVIAYRQLGTTGWGASGLPLGLWDSAACCSYTATDAGATITNYVGSGGRVTIPDTFGAGGVGLQVIGIAGGAFAGHSNLTSVTLGKHISSIADDAFADCPALSGLYVSGDCPAPWPTCLSSNLTVYREAGTAGWDSPGLKLGFWDAFAGCTYVTNQSGRATVTNYVGSGDVVTIPDTFGTGGGRIPVTSIGARAFAGCSNVTSIRIGNNVTNVGAEAFSGCARLSGLYFWSNCPVFDPAALSNAPAMTAYRVPGTTCWEQSGVALGSWDPFSSLAYTTNQAGATIAKFVSSSKALTIPGEFYTRLGSMPVTAIGQSAFLAASNLTSVQIGNLSGTNVGTISNWAFANCWNLTNLYIPRTVSSVGQGAFFACLSLPSIQGGDGLTRISEEAFRGCLSFSNLVVPPQICDLGAQAFEFCTGLTNVSLLGSSVTNLGKRAFAECTRLVNVNLGTCVASIGDSAFTYCTRLGGISFPASVRSIGGHAFDSCRSLTGVTIPSNVTGLGDGPFANCRSLTGIDVNPGSASFKSAGGVLFNVDGTRLIQYPAGKAQANYTLSNGVTTIGPYAFAGCTNLTSVTVPGSVTGIGDGAFSGCENLTAVYFQGNGPTNVGSGIFTGSANATVYYRPGATNWDGFAAASGLQVVLWRPQIQAAGVSSNCFRFTMTFPIELPMVVVEACTDLVSLSWWTLSTNAPASGTSGFTDWEWTNHPARFYRLRLP